MNHTTTYYKLCHSTDDTKEFYIGSTDNIKKRMAHHKSTYNNGTRQLKLYRYIHWGAWGQKNRFAYFGLH